MRRPEAAAGAWHDAVVRSVNVLAPPPDPAALRRRVGEALEATQIGACLYELAEGEDCAAYHFHHGSEEWLIALAGSPRVRIPNGERTLAPGDVRCFPVGPAGAHEVRGPGTVLLLSERRALDVVEFPGSGTIELRPSGRTFHGADAAAHAVQAAAGSVNLYSLRLEGSASDPPGYRKREASLGAAIGAARLGGSVYEIDPGNSLFPYHYEGVEEEWLLVLAGAPVLRDPGGEHELAAGDLACFAPGPDGGHKVSNRSESVARILMFSTVPASELSIAVYPDSGKVGVWPWPGKRLLLRDDVGYWDGEA